MRGHHERLDALVALIPTPFATLVPASVLVVKTHLTQSCIMAPNVPAVYPPTLFAALDNAVEEKKKKKYCLLENQKEDQ